MRSNGKKVAYSNQRVFNSRHSALSAAVGVAAAKRGGTAKPPLSRVQYGMPDTEKPSPAGICFLSAVQVDVMSPDHDAAANRCWPAKPLRVRMKTRWFAATARCPSYTAWLLTSEYAFSMRAPEPSAVGFMWVWLVLTCDATLVNGPSTTSGSLASNHQASTPLENRLLL